ncbi:MAG: effector binding domain-containing protein [Spirochaetes bacterium]|nr:effector binding domain-containing protein [Spirochaetota bacterium]
MIKHEVLELKEQKYAGIKTIIPFKDADKTDFSKLHKEVCEADIKNIDHHENFMAIDTDFTDSSFSYSPLAPVNSFDGNEEYTQFTRKHGTYCAFEVNARDLNPDWFKKVFEYISEKKISVENTGYDLEYYDEDYDTMVKNKDIQKERILKILLKMQSRKQ